MESEIERFRIWAVEVKNKKDDSFVSTYSNEDGRDASVERIKDLEAEIKKLAKKLQ